MRGSFRSQHNKSSDRSAELHEAASLGEVEVLGSIGLELRAESSEGDGAWGAMNTNDSGGSIAALSLEGALNVGQAVGAHGAGDGLWGSGDGNVRKLKVGELEELSLGLNLCLSKLLGLNADGASERSDKGDNENYSKAHLVDRFNVLNYK